MLNKLFQLASALWRPDEKELNRRLLVAVIDRNLEKVEDLLQAGARATARGVNGWTPLHYSSMNDDVAISERLIEAEAAFQEKLNKRLLQAVIDKNLARVDELLEAGASATARGIHGWTPLSYSSMLMYDNVEIKERLIKAKAKEAAIGAKGMFSREPLHATVKAAIGAKDVFGREPLHTAVEYISIKSIRLLLANNANIKAVDNTGATPLHFPAIGINIPLSNRLLAAGLLVAWGADKGAIDIYGRTPLDHAESTGETALADLLRRPRVPTKVRALIGGPGKNSL